METSEALECVRRLCALSYEEKPKMHKFYRYIGKVGTTASTIIWIVDKEEVKIGDYVHYIDESTSHICPANKYSYMKYLNEDHSGLVDRINDDGYIFINKI